jgi:hypothetical protein
LNHGSTFCLYKQESLLRSELDASLDDLADNPPLVLREWPRFFDPHEITRFAFIALIVRHEFTRPRDSLVIEAVPSNVINRDHHGLVHLVTNDTTDLLRPRGLVSDHGPASAWFVRA